MRRGYKMFLDLRSSGEYPSYYTGDYDESAIRACLRLLRPDSVVLDVGANIGFWTVPLAKAVQPAGSLFAFEPQEQNFRRLQKNVEINDLLETVSTHKIGLLDRAATVALSLREDFAGGASTGNAAIVSDQSSTGFAVENIEVVTLDELFPSLNQDRLDFIKVDIEGQEDSFLTGASRVIKRYRPIVYSEINNWYFAQRGVGSADWFSAWAAENQYEIAVLKGRHGPAEFIALRHADDLFIDVFLVPRERRDWFLAALAR